MAHTASEIGTMIDRIPQFKQQTLAFLEQSNDFQLIIDSNLKQIQIVTLTDQKTKVSAQLDAINLALANLLKP